MRFREEPVAMMADIESMFYQVWVPDKDADLLRFLWCPEGDLSQPIEEYRMAVHLFGATSSPSCASYALRRTAEDGRSKTIPEVVDTVLRNFYVDDCLKSLSSEDHAVALARDLRALCSSGGFRLTKWVSNSRVVLSSIPEEERATEVKDLDLSHNQLPMERALGIQWCTESDTFQFKMQPQDKPVTRQGILSVVSSIYDPLGFLPPFVLPVKLLLRDLCREKRGWDEEIRDGRAQIWRKWLADLEQLSSFHVERSIKPTGFGPTKTAQLHHFSDASENGYGTVTYILLTNTQGKKHISFLMGKSRVAPLKQVTIPRMELMAAVVAVKVDKMMKQELQVPLERSIFWTDSTTVLKYIENETARFKTFVANRISIIREATTPTQWRYVNTSVNPADRASRGLKAENVNQSETWIQGPSFLMKDESEWPERPDQSSHVQEDDVEIKRAAVVSLIATDENIATVNKLIDHYSSWHQLKKAVGWFLQLKKLLLHLSGKRKELQATISQSEDDTVKQEALLNPLRNSWMMGRILKTMPDANGVVRRVSVQTKTSTLERPITKLCLLQEAV
ncbi:hypothetical protein AAFF_G00184510 [Aldrovandia affinis]|uniref:DUF5641 domain-containing protein n=1 Tax=Aldrovandia affinis TaxID=143900 RepID=A0AAD7W7E3_9TELE|nr:hypothetical protein AAFF_G00184510 [Aldrovandia affinis]